MSPPPRVPPILSPDESHETISLRTPPQEDCKDIVMESGDSHQLVIKKEENLEYVEGENSDTPVPDPLQDAKSTDNEEEMISCKLKEDSAPILSPLPTEEPDLSRLSSTEEAKMETIEERQQLDAALSLMQVTSVVSSNPLSLISSSSPCLPVCTSTNMLSSLSMESSHSLSPPPITQSDNSSINSSSTESEHELSLMMLDTNSQHSLSSIGPPDQQGEGQGSDQRKRGHDSGVDNGSESDGPDLKRLAKDDLDFSIDMSEFTCICSLSAHVHVSGEVWGS